jgi:hypothetical protein
MLPEYFYRNLPAGSTVVFDEIHRINDPSTVVKIGFDEFPDIKILAQRSTKIQGIRSRDMEYKW